jgi:tetratricopeptide (TPR) repeat protein
MSLPIRPVAWLCAVLLLTQAGCRKALPDPASPAPALESAGPPPTEQEARQFADRMTSAVRAGDAAAIDQLLRLAGLAERVISDLGLSSRERQGFLAGVATSLRQASFGQQILQGIKGDGSYQLLRIRTVDGRPRPLFRMIHSEGALNYHDYALARHKDGEVVTEDMFVFVNGEPLSQTVRRLVIPALASLRDKGAHRGVDPQELSSLEAVGAMTRAFRGGDFKTAVTTYRTLPRQCQERKPILVLYVQATMGLGEDGEADYLAAMETFRKLFPNDAAVDFISIDYFLLKKRYDEARLAMDRLNEAVGGDPYLGVLRGTAWMEEGRFEEAGRAIEKAIQEEPGLTPAYWARVTLSLREKNHNDTLKWLKIIVGNRGVEVQDLAAVPEYAEFVKSPRHGEWQKWYATRGKGNGQAEGKGLPGQAKDD